MTTQDPLPPPMTPPAPAPMAPPAPEGKKRYDRPPAFAVAIAGIVAMVVGSIGPWAMVNGHTINGTTTGKDGVYVIVGGAIGLFFLIMFASTGRRGFLTTTVVFGVLAALIPIVDISDLSNLAGSFPSADISAGWGIYVALVGSAVLAIGSLIARITAPRR